MQKIKKLAVIVGHTEKDGGAVMNHPSKMCEYDFNTRVAKIMEQIQGAYAITTKIIYRDHIGLRGAYEQAVFFAADAIMELHFNSSVSEKASGALVLVSAEHKNHPLAVCVQSQILGLFGGNDRGLQVPFPTDRGWGNVNRGIPYFLLEPFFGSNKEQCEFALMNVVKYAAVLFDAVEDYNEKCT